MKAIDVRVIRTIWKEMCVTKRNELAEYYNVDPFTIRQIVERQTWKDLL